MPLLPVQGQWGPGCASASCSGLCFCFQFKVSGDRVLPLFQCKVIGDKIVLLFPVKGEWVFCGEGGLDFIPTESYSPL